MKIWVFDANVLFNWFDDEFFHVEWMWIVLYLIKKKCMHMYLPNQNILVGWDENSRIQCG